MTAFWKYTFARLALFAVTYGVLALIAYPTGLVEFAELTNLVVLLLALVISSVVGFFVLAPQRDALALEVQARHERVTARIEESRRAEDVD